MLGPASFACIEKFDYDQWCLNNWVVVYCVCFSEQEQIVGTQCNEHFSARNEQKGEFDTGQGKTWKGAGLYTQAVLNISDKSCRPLTELLLRLMKVSVYDYYLLNLTTLSKFIVYGLLSKCL